jgi:hypothetical protein
MEKIIVEQSGVWEAVKGLLEAYHNFNFELNTDGTVTISADAKEE